MHLRGGTHEGHPDAGWPSGRERRLRGSLLLRGDRLILELRVLPKLHPRGTVRHANVGAVEHNLPTGTRRLRYGMGEPSLPTYTVTSIPRSLRNRPSDHRLLFFAAGGVPYPSCFSAAAAAFSSAML